MFKKLFLILALFAFTMTACEFQEPVQPSPELAAAEGGDCENGESRSFEMEYWGTAGSFWVTVTTGPFQIGNCMCKMESFKLFVSKNGSLQWRLFVGSNQVVPYSWSASETEDVLIINDLKSIYENIGNPGTGKVLAQVATNYATLNHADGLCVIENYDGDGTPIDGGNGSVGAWAASPLIEITAGPVPDSYILEVYIPVGITNPI